MFSVSLCVITNATEIQRTSQLFISLFPHLIGCTTVARSYRDSAGRPPCPLPFRMNINTLGKWTSLGVRRNPSTRPLTMRFSWTSSKTNLLVDVSVDTLVALIALPLIYLSDSSHLGNKITQMSPNSHLAHLLPYSHPPSLLQATAIRPRRKCPFENL